MPINDIITEYVIPQGDPDTPEYHQTPFELRYQDSTLTTQVYNNFSDVIVTKDGKVVKDIPVTEVRSIYEQNNQLYVEHGPSKHITEPFSIGTIQLEDLAQAEEWLLKVQERFDDGQP